MVQHEYRQSGGSHHQGQRDIYLSLLSRGREATNATYKPDPLAKAEICTAGEFLADAAKRSHLRPRTAHIYAAKFRKLVADAAKIEAGVKKKAKRKKHDYHHGGRDVCLAKVEGKPLAILNPDVIAAWRNTYVAKTGTDPMKRKSAERSAASIMRAGRAL